MAGAALRAPAALMLLALSTAVAVVLQGSGASNGRFGTVPIHVEDESGLPEAQSSDGMQWERVVDDPRAPQVRTEKHFSPRAAACTVTHAQSITFAHTRRFFSHTRRGTICGPARTPPSTLQSLPFETYDVDLLCSISSPRHAMPPFSRCCCETTRTAFGTSGTAPQPRICRRYPTERARRRRLRGQLLRTHARARLAQQP